MIPANFAVLLTGRLCLDPSIFPDPHYPVLHPEKKPSHPARIRIVCHAT
jgi:hypothetical protein